MAEWLAFVGLRGRFCFVQGRGWLQWIGAAWKPSSVEHVRKGIRLSSEALHARLEKEALADGTLTEARRAKFYPLLDINRGFDLMPLIKRLVTIDGGQR